MCVFVTFFESVTNLYNLLNCFEEYIFPWPRKVSPRDGTEVKTCFICRGKVSFSSVLEKKDSFLTERSSCLTDHSSCLPERS